MVEKLRPVTAQVDQDDLRRRIAATRWGPNVSSEWDLGTPPEALREVLDRWAAFDWSGVENRIAEEDHVLVPGQEDLPVHFWRSGDQDAPALVLLHGWPDSFVRFRPIMPYLDGAFRTWVPSLPGFGYSAWFRRVPAVTLSGLLGTSSTPSIERALVTSACTAGISVQRSRSRWRSSRRNA